MTPDKIITLIERYGYVAQHIDLPQKGYRNTSYAAQIDATTTLNLIVYKSEPHILDRIMNAHYVGRHLAAKGLFVRTPVDTRVTCIRSKQPTKYAGLYTYLSGTTIPWEAYTMRHIKQLGAYLSTVHGALKDLPRGTLPAITDELRVLHTQIITYFSQATIQAAIKDKLGVILHLRPTMYITLFEALSGQPQAQPLHMDFVRGNILFDQAANISGVLDFEKTAWGLPVFDVARTLAFLLVDCKYKTERQVQKYFLYSGYNKRGVSHVSDDRLLKELTTFFLLHDFYKFLRHNPYESLGHNEHYVRTRDLLVAWRSISMENDKI